MSPLEALTAQVLDGKVAPTHVIPPDEFDAAIEEIDPKYLFVDSVTEWDLRANFKIGTTTILRGEEA